MTDELTQRQVIRVRQLLGDDPQYAKVPDIFIEHCLEEWYPSEVADYIRRVKAGISPKGQK